MGARQVVFLGLLAVVGCGGGAAVDRTPVIPSCSTQHSARNPSDTLTVVLFDKVDLSHAPWGRNREERFVFSHLYETLVTVDCHGQVQPALAKSILEASDGWMITLRDDAYFWDETPVTAQDVANSFEPAIGGGIAIKSVDVVDEVTLIVHGYYRTPFDLKLLAIPMLSIRKSNGGLPLGTGDWMINEIVPVAEAVVVRPVLSDAPVVRFVLGNPIDARDLVNGTADAIITDDRGAVDYAQSKDNVALVPLAWDKAYLLLSRSRVEYMKKDAVVPGLPAALCNDLANDAVAVEARGGSSIVVDGESACHGELAVHSNPSPARAYVSTARMMFSSEDHVAGALAQRIVALARMDTTTSAQARAVLRAAPGIGPGLRTDGVNGERLKTEVGRYDADADYVLPLSWDSDYPFVEDALARRAPWLFDTWPVSRAVLPLVETRAHFIALSGRIGFVDDGNGTVRIIIPSPGASR